MPGGVWVLCFLERSCWCVWGGGEVRGGGLPCCASFEGIDGIVLGCRQVMIALSLARCVDTGGLDGV